MVGCFRCIAPGYQSMFLHQDQFSVGVVLTPSAIIFESVKPGRT